MSGDGRRDGRMTNKDPLRFYMRDSENTVNYHPLDYFAHKGTAAMKIAKLNSALQLERQERYTFQGHAAFKAEIELAAIPVCFDHCVNDVSTTALNAVEKNCMRDCYFKRVTSRDDLGMFVSQLIAIDYGKGLREKLV